MACSLDELDNIKAFAEDTINTSKKQNNVGSRPRESFLLVRKPTKRKLTPNSMSPDQIKVNSEALSPSNVLDVNSILNVHPEHKLPTIDTSHIKSYISSHEDEIKSSASFSEKMLGIFPSDRDLKNQGVPQKGSRFRASHFQKIEGTTPISRSSIPSSFKLDEPSVNLSIQERKSQIQITKRTTGSFFSKTKIQIKAQRSFQADHKYLRAVNDKAEFLDDDILTHHETSERRLRGLLKKHAIKKKKTLLMKDVVQQIKKQQSRTWVSSNKNYLSLLILL